MNFQQFSGRKMYCVLSIILQLGLVPAVAYAQNYYPIDVAKALNRTPKARWAAQYAQAKARGEGFQVESVDEFIKINLYYQAFIGDGVIVHEFTTATGERIQCIDIKTQRSLKSGGLDAKDLLLAPADVPEVPGSRAENSNPAADFGLDGARDGQGQVRECPAGSFPKLIQPIETWYRFKKLSDRFAKLPDGGRPTTPLHEARWVDNVTHQYGMVYRDEVNHGEIADFNVWSPNVETGEEFSLSQLWVSRGEEGDNQTAEAGWQVYYYMYGNHFANLFIFSTSDDYETGCYNLDCPAFVQTDSSVVIGGALVNTSEIGGTQYNETIAFVRDGAGGNHWWLKVNGTWVGYYPNRLFDEQGIADQSDIINFGGELIDSLTGGNHTASEMGSGRFPNEGFGYAAYIKKIQVLGLDDVWRDAAGLASYATVPGCWDAGDVDYSSDGDWKTNFFFGGACGQCGGCVIGDICHSDGEVKSDNNCLVCDMSRSTTAWSSNDGASCNDNEFCNGADSCVSESCSGHAGNPCNAIETCNEDADICETAPDNSFCFDLLTLLYDQCQLAFVDQGEPVNYYDANQGCLNGSGDWACVEGCAHDDNVNGCDTFAQCLSESCSQSTQDINQSNNSDSDDDNSGSSGGSVCGC